jgi:hypothetical protein
MNATGRTRCRSYQLDARGLARAPRLPAGHPHLLQIVEGADFRPKHVNYDCSRIDQHPVTMRHAFDMCRNADFVQILDHRPDDTTM